MKADKVRAFMALAEQPLANDPLSFSTVGNHKEELRELGAKLLLSETLEYVIHGLGVDVQVGDVSITDPNGLAYKANGAEAACAKEMLDGLSDVAYTMYWNALAFGIPLDKGFDLVAENNLEKFVPLSEWANGAGLLTPEEWDCGCEVTWPAEVAVVQVVEYEGAFYAVGKDKSGKVRKPSTFKSVSLDSLLNEAPQAANS